MRIVRTPDDELDTHAGTSGCDSFFRQKNQNPCKYIIAKEQKCKLFRSYIQLDVSIYAFVMCDIRMLLIAFFGVVFYFQVGTK